MLLVCHALDGSCVMRCPKTQSTERDCSQRSERSARQSTERMWRERARSMARVLCARLGGIERTILHQLHQPMPCQSHPVQLHPPKVNQLRAGRADAAADASSRGQGRSAGVGDQAGGCAGERVS